MLRNPLEYPLPSWHPPLLQFINRAPLDMPPVSTFGYHPNVDECYTAGTRISDNHPSVQYMLADVLAKIPNHPNVDDLLREPAKNPLPSWHPKLEELIARREEEELPQISTFSHHPNADEYYAAGTPISDRHPSVQDMLADVLAKMPNHPNVDELLQDPVKNRLPSWHPKLEELIERRKEEKLPQISTFSFHPDVDASYAAGMPMSDEHPSVQLMMLAYLPESHRDCDIMLRNPLEYPLPSWHPKLEELISQREEEELPQISTFSYHPNADEYYAAGTPISDRHPLVQDMLADVLAKIPNHPNVDELLQDPVKNPLPSWHPKLEELIKRRKEEELPQISTFSFHPDVDASYAAGTPMSHEHPSVQLMMLAYLPESHRDCDIMLRNPLEYPLPSWHPPLLQFINQAPLDMPTVSTFGYHPNVDEYYASGTRISNNHPSVQDMLADVLAKMPNHPNVDDLLQEPMKNPLP
eukprot:scaffold258200_cov77-Attheya_sp.AAC.1